jgi:hypothetical protein
MQKILYSSARSQKGNMIVLIAAVTVGLVVALIFFCLNYSRLIGSNAEQKKAIEASALAAANDLSSIVIDTPEMGYVSLSDQAPVGTFTKAGDQFFMPIRGINTIIGTARLDSIIANQIPGASSMQTLAQNDLTNAKSVISQLDKVLTAALTSKNSPQAVDRNNNQIKAYADAQNSYVQNLIRMTGSASYVPGSLVLTLGSLNTPSETNIPIPQPTGIAPLAAGLVQNNNYKSFVNIPYSGVNYVFGGIGDTPRLVDIRNFVLAAPGVAYQVPTIVKAECDELIKTSQTPNGAVFHTAACAQASSNFDPKPAPGAIAIEFPDGQVPEFSKPADLLTKLPSPAVIQTSPKGDYPVTAPALSGGPDPWPPNVASTTMGDAWCITLYDWIRRGGTRANITSVVNMQTTPFTGAAPAMVDWWGELTNTPPLTDITQNFPGVGGKQQIPMGIMHAYKWDPSGNVNYKPLPTAPYPYEVVSENQLYAEVAGIANGAFKSSTPVIAFDSIKVPMPQGIKGKKGSVSGTIKATVHFIQYFDIYVRDQCRVQGLQNGGKHGGEPLNDALVVYATPASNNIACQPLAPARGLDYGASGFGAGSSDSGATGPQVPPPTNGNGMGSPPILSAESDFGDAPAQRALAFPYPPPYVKYATGSAGGQIRTTYQTTALTGSIRFRREIQITGFLLNAVSLSNSSPTDIGYLAGKQKQPGVTYTVSDPSTGYYPDVDVVDDFKDK